MIWIFLFLVLTAAVLYLGVRLFLYQKQLRALTRQLEELNDDSNQRLTCFLQDGAVTALCRQINQCIDIQQVETAVFRRWARWAKQGRRWLQVHVDASQKDERRL